MAEDDDKPDFLTVLGHIIDKANKVNEKKEGEPVVCGSEAWGDEPQVWFEEPKKVVSGQKKVVTEAPLPDNVLVFDQSKRRRPKGWSWRSAPDE